MGSSNLELAFYGELLTGFSEADVKQNMAAMFKASLEQIERMFTGNRVVIRNKLDFDTARKYVVAMEKRGAVCKIEQMGQPGIEVKDAPHPSEQAAAVPVNSEAVSKSMERQGLAPDDTKTVVKPREQSDTLDVAGDRVEEILSGSCLQLDPVGIRLSDEKASPPEQELTDLAGVELLPPGSDLQDQKEEKVVNLPDISHLSLKKTEE